MKVLLVNPPFDRAMKSEASPFPQEASGSYPPLGLMYLQIAAEAKRGHQVDLVDATFPGHLESYLDQNADTPPMAVGISAMTPNLASITHTIDRILKAWPDVIIILGGPHVDVFPHETVALDGVDLALRGECEDTFPKVLSHIERGGDYRGIPGVYSKDAGDPNRPIVESLDTLPYPNRSKIGVENYTGLAGRPGTFTTVLTSRSCPYQCTFCSTPRDNYRFRSADSIVEEVISCIDQGVEHVYFLDDCFPAKGKRLAQLCEGLAKMPKDFSWSCRTAVSGLTEDGLALMKKSGCLRVQLGVETNTNEGLKGLGKAATIQSIRKAFQAANKVGMETMAYFMLGLPNEQKARDVMAMVDFAISLRPTFAMFNILTLYPGTVLFTRATNRLLVDPDFWRKFVSDPDPDVEAPFWSEHMDRQELEALQVQAYRKFYWRPSILIRNLFAGGGIKGVFHRLKVGLSMVLNKAGHK